MDIANRRFEERASQERFNLKIDALLRIEFEDFFRLGQKEKAKDIKPIIDILTANVTNEKLSDADFRGLVAGELVRLNLKV